MENSNIINTSNDQKYDAEYPKNIFEIDKDLVQDDGWSDSKSEKHSNSNSYRSRNISRKNSSQGSEYEKTQRNNEIRYSPNYQDIHQKTPNEKSPKLDFLIFFSTKIKDSLLDNKILDSIISQIGGITMEFDIESYINR